MASFPKRLLSAAFTILVATVLSFVLIRSMPGDFLHQRALEIMKQQHVHYPQAYEMAKGQYNYDPDAPLLEQFLSYAGQLARGNLGTSLVYRIPVADLVLAALPWTLFLCGLSLFCSFLLGSALGLAMAWYREHRFLETAANLFATLTQSIPDFVVGLLLLVFLAVNLGLFPLRGAYDLDLEPGLHPAFLLSVLHHAALPALAFVISTVGNWALVMRASAVSILSEDWMDVARAKGLRPGRIFRRYLGRNAFIPVLPGLALAFAGLVGGSLFVESLFAYPGIGYFFGFSIASRDFTLLQGLLLLSTATVVVVNLLADRLYAWIDPRVQES